MNLYIVFVIWNNFPHVNPLRTGEGGGPKTSSKHAARNRVEYFNGFPKLVKGNQIIEYDAKPSVEHLKEFLNSTLA